METKLFDLLLGIVADRDLYVEGTKIFFTQRSIGFTELYDSIKGDMEKWTKEVFGSGEKQDIAARVKSLFEGLDESGYLLKADFITACVYLFESLYGINLREHVDKYMLYDNVTGKLSSKYGKLCVELNDDSIKTIIDSIEWAMDKVRNRPEDKGYLIPLTKKQLVELETNFKFLKFIVPADKLNESVSTEENLIEEMSSAEFNKIKGEFISYIDDCIKNDKHIKVSDIILEYNKEHSSSDLYTTFLFAVVKYIYDKDIPMNELGKVSIESNRNDLLVDYDRIATIETTGGHYLLWRNIDKYNLSSLETIIEALEERLDESKDESDYDSDESVWDSFCKKYGK